MEENTRHWLHRYPYACKHPCHTHSYREFLQKDRILISSHPLCPENQRSSLAYGIVLKVWIACFIYLFVAVGLVYMSIYKSLPSLGLSPVYIPPGSYWEA